MSNAVSILGYGPIGLGLLLAILAYRLLLSGSVHERQIYVFEGFCLALVAIGALLQYTSSSATSAQNETLLTELQSTKGALATATDNARSAESKLSSAKLAIGSLAETSSKAFPNASDLASSVSRITNLVTQSCSGGPHGTDPAHAEEIRAIAADASQRIASAKANIDNITQRAQGEAKKE